MATKDVCGHARVAGVWTACEVIIKHPSTGFWSDFNNQLEKSHVRVAGTWEVFATDLQRGLSTSTANRDVFDFDFNSPWFSEAGIRILTNGNVQEKHSGNAYSANGNEWLTYNNLHGLWNYGITISDDDSHNLDTVNGFVDSIEEAVSTTYNFETTLTTSGQEDGRFSVRFTNWDSPSPKPTYLDFTLEVNAENNPF